MHKPTSINELLGVGGKRLAGLKAKSVERTSVLTTVRAALPVKLAEAVISAGIEAGQLIIGVNGASWAARLRYLAAGLLAHVGESRGVELKGVRIRVVPPRA